MICWSHSSSVAAATATCPPSGTFKPVAGNIAAVGSGGVTVTDSSRKATQILIPSTVRITRVITATSSDLSSGTAVQVVTDTNATTAKSIRILSGSAGATDQGSFGQGSQGGACGTPEGGANRGCFRRGQGQGQGTGTDQGQAPGQSTGFQGLRGTVDSATSSKLTFDDAQGQTFSVAITSDTTISKVESAQIGNLRTGMKVTLVGDTTSAGVSAGTISVQS